MFNILTEPLIRMDATADSGVPATLPQVYAALMADKVDAFPALRPHQRHAWHAFLVQLGAMALHRTGLSQPPAAAAEWCKLIRSLTPDYQNDEPWRLVVEDITQPAFMQPPASTPGKLAEYKSAVETPDELDMLVTSKNHDLKAAVTSSATINDWLFALITLQTTEGFGGAGNYGISRMNGGLGCRPAFTLAPALEPEIHTVRPGLHARRDLGALLECREQLLNDYRMYPPDGGIRLLWIKPWDGKKVETLSLSDLDPFYIEICRRIRLQADGSGTVSALRATSKAARIEAKAQKGRTGDPWTPVTKEKSLTLAAGGFSYRQTAAYFTPPDWQTPPLFALTAAERRSPQDMLLVARGMVRGQGKTEGYHERIVPFKRDVLARAFGRVGGREELGKIAAERIADVRKVQRILRHAIWTFAAGGKTEGVGKEQRDRADPWADKLDEIVDTTFFEELQTEFEADDPGRRKQIRNHWLKNNDQDGVIDRAWQILWDAEDSLPCPAIQRYRARVRADSVFNSRIRSPKDGFPELYDQEGGSE